MKNTKNIQPGIDFYLTDKCNYKCTYCDQGKHLGPHASDSVIDAFIKFIKKQDSPWRINLIGGEVFLHPRFFEIVQKTVGFGHKIGISTNFSCSFEKLKKLVDICGNNLETLQASLHLTQVKSLDEFIGKAVKFQEYKNKNTDFSVVSVLTVGNFQDLKQVKEKLESKNVVFLFQHMRKNGNYVHYPPYIYDYLKSTQTITNLSSIRNIKSFGLVCYTGYKFFCIDPMGNTYRCHNHGEQGFLAQLGNIQDKNFKLYKKPLPCLSDKCTCTLPADLNMIEFNEKELLKAYSLWPLVLPYKTKAIFGSIIARFKNMDS